MNFKKKLFSIITFLLLGLNKNCYASGWNDPSGNMPAEFSSLEGLFERVLGMVIAFGGLAAFIMLLIGGFHYLTSGGNAEEAAKGKATLTWAFIGILALIGIWFIMQIISKFTGVTQITEFDIPGN
jgi:hypothetical protein